MLRLNIFNQLPKYLKKLNEAPEGEFVGGFIFGMFLGLIPPSINSFFIALLLFIANVDKTAGVIATGLFGMLSFFLDPLAHEIGYFVLTLPALKGFFTMLYNAPFLAFSSFNNSLVMGNTLLALLLIYPVSVLVRKFLRIYRQSDFKEQITRILANKYFSLFHKIFNFIGLFRGSQK